MDPEHVACYAKAQVELRELFHDLECNGQVSAAELQRSLIPFTAGDVKRDLLELLVELKSKRQTLDETEFIRVMWRKMYLMSAIDATKSGAPREHKHINVSLAHVIVSVKRRRQLRQFASYYTSRGISGADHLIGPSTCSLESIGALRRRLSPCYDVVACCFDADLRQMRTRTLLTKTRSAEVRSCTRLYCLLFSKEAGNFVLGNTYFGERARCNHQNDKDAYGITTESEIELLSGSSLYRTFNWSDRDNRGLLMVPMEDVGLRNIIAGASNRVSFAASTGRKLHQWRALEPYRVLERDSSEEFSVRMLDADPMGDCFGLLGGRPLLSRTKTIADIGGLRQLVAGDDFFMATSSSGGLYSWESNPSSAPSSLGRGCVTPERVPWFAHPEKVFRVACGTHHALALTSSGVYAWGSNIYGQLGLGVHCSPTDPQTLEPAPVWLPADCTSVLDVACGDTHSVVLSAAGQVFTFGCNWEGQLGIDEAQISNDVATTGCAYEPLPVLLPLEPERRVYLITAGPQTTVVVTTTGQVFQWGKCVPTGVNGVCGQINRLLPEDLKTISEYDDGLAAGPVWHSIAIADGLVVLTRHATPNSSDEGLIVSKDMLHR
ncbi:Regulator of chromosome condensation, RCC1 domain containing hypothetical protein [Phytophthora palmivora]|uniref:Regulator of chromosome condensation (RCC1)-like protein n=1 Tax=Phytophthora palmivora TaxID=4796 RepID=A0A2P4XV30_9STRA|nr:Regulator of chromosome condensation, RCC1 domain containing hypothetical protein [Phytophthora palmivora]